MGLTCLLFSPHRFKNLEILYEINHIKYYEDWMYSRRFLLLWWALRLLDVVYRVKYSFRNAFYTHVFQTSYLNLLNSCLIKLDLKLYLEVVFLIWRKYNFLRCSDFVYFRISMVDEWLLFRSAKQGGAPLTFWVFRQPLAVSAAL